ncbi:MAG: hypothetical protein R3B06_22825 [Kofleriaceae bacterium]
MTEAIRVVAAVRAELQAHLAAAPLARAGVVTALVDDLVGLRAAVRAAPPAVVIIDVELAGDAAFATCRRLKDDPATAGVRVALVVEPGGLDRAALAAVAAAGCDEVLAPPLSFDDFCAHLTRLSAVPLRRTRRVDANLALELAGLADGAELVNVAPGGIGIRAAQPLTPGDTVALRLVVDGVPGPAAPAAVAWCAPTAAGAPFSAGLRWLAPPPVGTQVALEQVASYDLTDSADGVTTVCLHGDFSEMTSFAPLAARLAGSHTVSFDLGAVRYVSSAGVRAWCELLGKLGHARLSFCHCSVAFVTQAAMVPLVLAGGTVRSLAAPYYCEACGTDDERLLEVGVIARDGDRLVAPTLACPRCGAPADLDDLPERYFAFLA